uniref:Uncharacterized protein n=1 Tax=Nelumbo nucifera TaxID=4432 RepID=A0A822YSL2_NELNU|nr:TPA_asm: hypothetical protein HUJ06_007775 [Nelumbo nucifera]
MCRLRKNSEKKKDKKIKNNKIYKLIHPMLITLSVCLVCKDQLH